MIVQEGCAQLMIEEKQHLLKSGDVFVIPAGQNHSLSLETDSRTLVIMEVNSSIEFEK